MTLHKIRAYHPISLKILTLYYNSIEEARQHNPYLKGFEYVI